MNTLQKYFKNRQGLIDQYSKGDLTKSEYLEQNLNLVLSLNIKPFKNIDSVDKALFNYQYYNAYAKYMKSIGEKTAYYYRKKDYATQKVLEITDYENAYAYYVKSKSKYLNGILFEIVLEEYGMILHSTNEVLLNKLKNEGIFINEKRKSLIDGYINQKY